VPGAELALLHDGYGSAVQLRQPGGQLVPAVSDDDREVLGPQRTRGAYGVFEQAAATQRMQ
jgi:hypothetical protein